MKCTEYGISPWISRIIRFKYTDKSDFEPQICKSNSITHSTVLLNVSTHLLYAIASKNLNYKIFWWSINKIDIKVFTVLPIGL